MTRTLGIDFGGTKILAGVVDTESGEILSQAKKRTHSEQGYRHWGGRAGGSPKRGAHSSAESPKRAFGDRHC
jgi:ribulose kinase